MMTYAAGSLPSASRANAFWYDSLSTPSAIPFRMIGTDDKSMTVATNTSAACGYCSRIVLMMLRPSRCVSWLTKISAQTWPANASGLISRPEPIAFILNLGAG